MGCLFNGVISLLRWVVCLMGGGGRIITKGVVYWNGVGEGGGLLLRKSCLMRLGREGGLWKGVRSDGGKFLENGDFFVAGGMIG